MSKNSSRKSNEMAQYSMWMIERWERMNEALDQLAVTVIGFLGLEIALIGTSTPHSDRYHKTVRVFTMLSVASLVVSVISFLIVLNAKTFYLPGKKDLKNAYRELSLDKQMEVIELVLSDEKDMDILTSLESENSDSSTFYRIGMSAAILGQLLLAIAIASGWMNWHFLK